MDGAEEAKIALESSFLCSEQIILLDGHFSGMENCRVS
jgi:hypothetical protein